MLRNVCVPQNKCVCVCVRVCLRERERDRMREREGERERKGEFVLSNNIEIYRRQERLIPSEKL